MEALDRPILELGIQMILALHPSLPMATAAADISNR